MRRPLKDTRQTGSTLMSAMIAVGLVGVLAVLGSTLLSESQKGANAMSARDEFISLRRTLRAEVDCAETLKASACSGEAVPLKNGKGATLGSASNGAYKLGGWHFKSTCTQGRLDVLAARLNQTGALLADPITGKAEWQNLFPLQDLDCSERFANKGLPCSGEEGGGFCSRSVSSTRGTGQRTAQCLEDELATGCTFDVSNYYSLISFGPYFDSGVDGCRCNFGAGTGTCIVYCMRPR